MIRTKTFTLETLVFADKGVLTNPWAVFDLMSLIDFVSGESNCPHQIPKAVEQIRPFIRKQLPWLADVPDLDGIETRQDMDKYLLEQIERFGSSHEVKSMPQGLYDNWDPQHAQRQMEEDEAEKEMAAHSQKIVIPGGPEMAVDFNVEDIIRAGGKTLGEILGHGPDDHR
jgi:hypothetical protein